MTDQLTIPRKTLFPVAKFFRSRNLGTASPPEHCVSRSLIAVLTVMRISTISTVQCECPNRVAAYYRCPDSWLVGWLAGWQYRSAGCARGSAAHHCGRTHQNRLQQHTRVNWFEPTTRIPLDYQHGLSADYQDTHNNLSTPDPDHRARPSVRALM